MPAVEMLHTTTTTTLTTAARHQASANDRRHGPHYLQDIQLSLKDRTFIRSAATPQSEVAMIGPLDL